MLEFKCLFDAEDDILPFISEEKRDGATIAGRSVCNLRVVGQEQDSALLYTWDTPVEEDAAKVSHVGLYDPVNKKNKVLFVHDKLVNIVCCTISQEHRFLGFVTLDQEIASESYGKKNKRDVYRAYLAEVGPQNRVFYLNLERNHFILLHFLYGQYHGHVSRRESHLLVLLHRESIGLYHLPVARVGDEGVIMSGEPKKDQIFQNRFVWSQWDPTYQRLYVAHFRRQGKALSGGQTTYKCILTCYQFTAATVNEFMIDVPLDLPLPPAKTSIKTRYHDMGPCHCIPDAAINMCVLTQPNGTMCICFQHPVRTSHRPGSVSSPDADNPVQLQYSICMVHNGKVLKCSGIVVPSGVGEQALLHFTWLGDYLVVHLDGFFTHLLNVSAEFQPCHHILWHAAAKHDDSGLTESSTEEGDPPTYIPYLSDKSTSSSAASNMGMFDLLMLKAYKVSLCREVLEETFMSSSTSTTRLAILHYAIVHMKDLQFTKKLFEAVCNDIANPEVVGLLEEFLIGSTYVALKRQVDSALLHLMPFTCSKAYTGQAESTSEGDRLSSISYTQLGAVTLGNPSKSKSDYPSKDMWNNLSRHVRQDQANSRFSSQDVYRDISIADETEEEFVRVPEEEAPSFLKRFTAMAKSALSTSKHTQKTHLSNQSSAHSRQPSRSEIVLGSPPAFLSASPEGGAPIQERLLSRTNEMLFTHLRKYLKRDSRSKIKNIAAEYVTCQLQQSRQLVHLMCNILLPDDISATMPLYVGGGRQEYELFLLLERFYLAVELQAFPYPPGFSLYFTMLGFRCLQFRLFLQYTDRHVLRVTPEFMKKMLEDLPDTDEHMETKYEVLLRLPPAQGVECARLWPHPVSKRFLAQHYTNACLIEGVKEEFEASFSQTPPLLADQSTRDGAPTEASLSMLGAGFPPLTMFISLLEKKASRQSERGGSILQDADKHLLEEVGLSEFYRSGGKSTDILTFG